MPWHALAVDEVLRALNTARGGLAGRDAAARRAQYGPNRLPPPPPVHARTILFRQLASVVVLLLAAAMTIAFALGDRVEAAAIGAVLLTNTAIGFITELRARRAVEALLRYDTGRASVVRNGKIAEIDAAELVPGDVLHLEAGDRVPADGRLIESSELRLDEAPLTGESLPVSKHANVLDDATLLGDRRNMVYKGTTVVAGAALAVITDTGPRTELGRIGVLVQSVAPERTPLEVRLDVLGRRLIWITLAIAAVVAGLQVWHGSDPARVFETSLALAIAAVPEALPTVVTIALAVGVRRMARRHALVRRLPAVETLGSTTVVCTDKTLTLTTGEMTLSELWPFDTGERPLIETAALASPSADPMDTAIVAAAERAGMRRASLLAARPERGAIPFSSARKYAAVFAGDRVFVKGAPSRLLELSDVPPLDRDRILAANAEMAQRGLRVLAFASAAAHAATGKGASLPTLTFEGLGGFVDPPSPGVKEAIATLKRAGLRTVMITGDQKATGEAIARELGVDEVHGRVSPEDKLRIVEDLQSRGEIVAMLGDGVNDAPALKRANVGVAMGGRGTDVAKEAAAIVLQDDRFETVAAAVEEGRVIYANIRKFVFYLFSCNLAEVLVLLAASVAGLPLPLLPLQLLWLNLLTDTFPALALAVEPADRSVMDERPRRPDEALLSGSFLAGVALYAAIITAVTLAAFIWALGAAPDRATTVAFMTLAFAQIFHLGNARSAWAVLAPAAIVANPWALGAAAAAAAIQIGAVVLTPLRHVLHLTPLTAADWLVVGCCAAIPALLGQFLKTFARR